MEQLANMPLWAQLLSMGSFMFASGVLMTRIPLAPALILSFFYLYGVFGTSAEMPNFTLKNPSFWLCVQIALFLIVCTIVATTNDKGPVVGMGWAGLVVMGVLGIAFCVGGVLSIIVNLYKYLQLSIFCFSKVNFTVLGILCFVAGAVFGGLTIARPYISATLPPVGLWLGFSYIAMALLSVLACGMVLWGISKGMPSLSLIAIFLCAAILLCEYPLYQYVHLRGPQAREMITAVEKGDAAKLQAEQLAVQKDASDSDSTTAMNEEGKANLDKLLKIVNRINQINEEASHAEPIENPEDVRAFAKLCKDCPPDVVKRVLEAKTINDPIYDDGGTALHAASYLGLVEQIQPLLAAGADVNKQDNDGGTPLLMASYNGHTEVVKMLIAAGADVNYFGYWNALMNASDQGHLDIVNVLLKAGADVNAQDSDSRNWTALMCATQHGYNDIVNTLLAAGAKVDARDSGGGTALMTACYTGHLDTAKILLLAGADINATDNYGKSVINFAQKGGHADVINFLRTNINMADQFGETPLLKAVEKGQIEEIKNLIAQGADVNFVNHFDESILVVAVKKNQPEIVQLLIAAGAEVNYKNRFDKSILQIAREKGFTEIADLLKSAGAKE